MDKNKWLEIFIDRFRNKYGDAGLLEYYFDFGSAPIELLKFILEGLSDFGGIQKVKITSFA